MASSSSRAERAAAVPAALRDEVARRIDRAMRDMVALTKDLVGIATENPPGRRLPECAARIARELKRLDLAPRVLNVRAGARATAADRVRLAEHPRRVVMGATGGRGPALHFHGHYDVVPAISPSQFEPRVANGRLHGRGSGDMKGGLAAMIHAAHALRGLLPANAGRIALTFVPDEETGGAWGSRWLLARGLLGRDGLGMLTPEPTGGVVWHACRGALTLRLTIRGKPAHVGLQHQGINAFERMLPVARAFEDYGGRIKRRATRYPIRPAAARRSILLLGGRSEAGTGFNVVPGSSSFTVDRRFNPEESLVAERRNLMALVDRFRRRGTAIDVEVLQEGDACGTRTDDVLSRSLAASVRDVTGRAPRFEMCPGLLEIRFYQGIGVPALAYGPGALEVAHGPAEFVGVEALRECALIYALTALRMLRG